jgi:hypothetical protein
VSDEPYSGVVHADEVAGFTGIEGYTGVVPVEGSTATSETAQQALELAGLASTIANAQQRVAAQPQPAPNRALEAARLALRGGTLPDFRITPFAPLPSLSPVGIGPIYPFGQDLLGPGADALRQQAADVVAATRPSSLGIAYLQGIGLGLFDAAIGAAQGLAEAIANPIGSGLRQAKELMQQIDARIAQGESLWEAANSVLNPVARFFEEASVANALAGQAIEAAKHDWSEAVRLSREAGRAAAAGGVAAAETFDLAHRTVGRIRQLRTALPRRRGTPPTPPARRPAPEPPRSPQSDGEIGRRPLTRSEVDPIPVRRSEPSDITGKALALCNHWRSIGCSAPPPPRRSRRSPWW